MNPKANFDNINYQDNYADIDEPLNTDNLLNDEENIDLNENINLNNQEMEYLTDSDIDDPKYMPTGNIPQLETDNNIENINNYDNNINIGVPSHNDFLIQNQIANVENKSMIANKTLQQLESENDQLKAELMKKQAKMQSNEGINNQFKQLFVAFKQRFGEYEKRNDYLQKYANELEEKLKMKEMELTEVSKDKNKVESALKNANIYKQYADELQNEFKEKSKKLNEKYNDKEKNLKNEFIEEIKNNMEKIKD